jgi:acetylornithine/N-succinyldiaminopimelate aminotransferase
MSLLLKRSWPRWSIVTQVLAEVRGKFLVGVKAVVPSGDLVTALRGLLTVGAGDNVVRFLAPLIVSKPRSRIRQCLERLHRCRATIERRRGHEQALRHFLDINELPPKEYATCWPPASP